jgi:PAS domain S-box-containing protein
MPPAARSWTLRGMTRLADRLRELTRSAETERTILDAMPLATVVFDREANVVRWNAAAERLFGWTAEEVIGLRNPTVPDDDRPRAEANHARIVAGGHGGVEVGELVRRTRDGRLVEVHVFATPLPDEVEELGSYVVVYEDIGARKRAQRELLAAQRQFRELIEALPLVTYVDEVRPGSPAVYTSPQIQQLLGWSAAAWIENPYFQLEILHPDDKDRVLAATAHTNATHEPFLCEYRLRHRDGHYVWVRDRSQVVVDDDGTALARGFLLDITEEKRLEGQLLQSQKMDALGQLAGGIAHDFNNLLTGITGYADLAAEASRNPSVARCLDGVRAAADEAAALTARLLAFSRRDVLERKPVDVNAAVRDAAELLRPLLRENVRLTLDLAPGLPAVAGDPGQVKQLVLNLALNARDAMPDSGAIRIVTEPSGAGLVLRVADNGVGMDETTRSRALEPFFTTKEEGHGTGLGLAVVYGVVESCEGSIDIRSAPGAGTTVSVELPGTAAEPAAREQAPVVPAGRGGGERVLVVEDRDIVRELACSILEDAGYRVVSAPGGPEALELADDDVPFSLLLTDVVMPEMSGADLATRLRAAHPALRVLYMSGYTADVLGDEELALPHTAFLRKPFGTGELTAAVRGLLAG